jgi:hypothetical protein
VHRDQEFFLRQRASCVSTQLEANETNSVMVLRSSFSDKCSMGLDGLGAQMKCLRDLDGGIQRLASCLCLATNG